MLNTILFGKCCRANKFHRKMCKDIILFVNIKHPVTMAIKIGKAKGYLKGSQVHLGP